MVKVTVRSLLTTGGWFCDPGAPCACSSTAAAKNVNEARSCCVFMRPFRHRKAPPRQCKTRLLPCFYVGHREISMGWQELHLVQDGLEFGGGVPRTIERLGRNPGETAGAGLDEPVQMAEELRPVAHG